LKNLRKKDDQKRYESGCFWATFYTTTALVLPVVVVIEMYIIIIIIIIIIVSSKLGNVTKDDKRSLSMSHEDESLRRNTQTILLLYSRQR